MSTFTRVELVHKLSEKTGITLAQAHEALTNVFEIVEEALVEGRKVEFRGFGSFVPKVRAGRMGRNPRIAQAAPVKIPAKKVVKFKIGSNLFAALNKEPVEA